MASRSSTEQWGWVTRLLHWSIAIAVLGMIAAGLYAKNVVGVATPADETLYFSVIDVHKSFGLLVISLMAIRVLWRLSERSPLAPANTPMWEIVLARISQMLLYMGLFAMPVSGFLWASAYGEPVRFFGVKLPTLIHLKGEQATLAHHVHLIVAFVLIAIIGLHLLGALKNHFVNRNNVLRDMLGISRRPT